LACGRHSADSAIGALPNVEPSWNVTPTNRRPVIRRHPETGERRLDLLRLVPATGYALWCLPLCRLRSSRRFPSALDREFECGLTA
jgi:putative SOS response-associated peptidase YedK